MNMHDKFGIDIIPVKFWKEVDCKKKKTHGKVSNSFNFQRNLHFLLKLNVKLYSFKKGHVLISSIFIYVCGIRYVLQIKWAYDGKYRNLLLMHVISL